MRTIINKIFMLTLLWAVSAVSLYAAEPIKILAIGNSFSEDAIENNFHEVCASEGVETIVGNLYIGGCNIERHYNNAIDDLAEYRYRKIGVDGVMTQTNDVRLSEALHDEHWDYISFQQASHDSGIYTTFLRLPELIRYVRGQVGEHCTFMWQMTWAYSIDSTHSGFANYANNQMRMYQDIITTAQRIMLENPELKVLIPTGTAIQDARTILSQGQNLTRDGYHLELTVGRYIASLTWYAAIFRRIIDVNTVYAPHGLSAAEKQSCVDAAMEAVMHPWTIKPLW